MSLSITSSSDITKLNISRWELLNCLVCSSPTQYCFLDVNTRLQVEHTVTESLALVYDLVRAQFLSAQEYTLSSLF